MSNVELNYNIKLIQFNFDNKYDDVRLFETKALQSLFFKSQKGIEIQNVNFIARDLIKPEITFLANDIKLIDLLNYNYCIVTNTKDDKELYFWINESYQDSGSLITLNCEIDPIQTYLFEVDFDDCLINRAHTDRFETVSSSKVKFKCNKSSDLFEREPIQDLSKRLVERRKLNFKIDNDLSSDFNNYVIDKSVGWVYIYLSEGNYHFYQYDGKNWFDGFLNNITYKKGNLAQEGGTAVICYPLNADFKFEIKTVDGQVNKLKVDKTGFEKFSLANQGLGLEAKIYAIKYSLLPPFKNGPQSYKMEDGRPVLFGTAEGNLVWSYSDNINIYKTNDFNSDNPNEEASGIIHLKYQDLAPKELVLKTNITTNTFDRELVRKYSNQPIYNPKLLNEDYSEMVLSIYGNTFKYDIQKLNDQKPEFLYYEALTPDITKSLVVYNAKNNDNIFNEDTKTNYSGLMSTIDNSILFSTDKLQQYLANNKNAFLSFQTNQIFSGVKGIGASLAGTLTSSNVGGPTNPVLATVGAVAGLVKTGLDLAQNQIQFDHTIDNMRSAPNQLVNANGNAIFLNSISDIGVYLNIYKIIPNEEKVVNDFLNQYGFVINKIDNPKNYLRTRQFYNFIKCVLTNINGQVSNNIKDRIKSIFEHGVRFWHTDKVDFKLSNYERWL